MCVIMAMVMQTTLMDQLHVLLNPSTGLGQKTATCGQRTFKYKLLLSFLLYISHRPHANMPRTDIW